MEEGGGTSTGTGAVRFELTEDDLNRRHRGGGDGGERKGGYDDVGEAIEKIPILRRRAATAAAAAAAESLATTTLTTTFSDMKVGCADATDVDGSDGAPASAADGGAMTPPSPATTTTTSKDPVCVIVIGMAGSGKTTLMTQLQRSLNMTPREGGIGAAGDDVEEEDEEKGDGGGDEGDEKRRERDEEEERVPNSRCGYCINLDPAAKYVPFEASIDIRDTVDYLEVMKQHKLGPNGAILTCLNLFATKFEQVMAILEKRAFGTNPTPTEEDGEVDPEAEATAEETSKVGNSGEGQSDGSQTRSPLDYILIDTPGQIEAFTWSASGTIVSESLATSFPTVLVFVVDVPRCAASVHTFMSNMLYACSVLYRTRLPLVVALNKIDAVGCGFVEEWMDDYEAFQEALDDAAANSSSYDSAGGSGYYSSLTRSLSLVLDEFYRTLRRVGVSAATGEGIDKFWEVVDDAAGDYEKEYLVDLKNRVDEQGAKRRAVTRAGARRLARDMEEDAKNRELES